MALGLTSDDPLPDVSEATLRTYRKFLAAQLSFPFGARYGPEFGRSAPLKVSDLGYPEDEGMIDEEYGLLCVAHLDGRLEIVPLAEVGAARDPSNDQLLEDYSYWFVNWR